MDSRRQVLIYIAGPISSNLSGYKAEFRAAEALLQVQGYETINPADNPPQPSWLAYMRLSITQLVTADGIAVLPGWWRSRGARLEWFIARMLGMIRLYL